MFMGHYGPAVWDTQRGKTVPLLSLWQAFLAVQAIDILWAVLVILGVEGQSVINGKPLFHIPWSHSLISVVIIAVLVGGIFWLFKKNASLKGAVVIAALVFSHWVLDLIVHRPDLPIYPGGSYLMGFSVWDYPRLAFLLEIGLLFIGFSFWVKVTRAKTMIYKILPWGLFAFMVALQYLVITAPGLEVQAGTFDPSKAPQGASLGLSALFAFGLLTVLIAWVERGRPSIYASSSST